MQTIIKHKTKLIAIGVALFAVATIFAGISLHGLKAQACDTGCLPPVDGFCVADLSSANIGQTVTFTVHPSGGTGVYVYTWSGDDGLTGHNPSVSKSYSTSGTKTATVSITSNGQTVSRSCSTVIKSAGCDNSCFPNVSGFCTASPTQADIGQTVTFTVHPSGGTGVYVYTWSGDDGLTGHNPSVSKSYSTSGTKTATVSITSNGQTVNASCNTYVNQPIVNNLTVFCVANPTQADIGQLVNFSASASGGNGNFTYSWTGDDGLSGNSQTVFKTYSSSGTKTGTVTVTSDGQTRSASCSTFINENNNNENLGGFCEGSPSNPDQDERVTWTAFPSGGNGNYDYSWSGDDGLDGNNKSESITYNDSGTKDATVRITSNGQTITRTCTVNVRNNNNNNNNIDAFCEADQSTVNVGERVEWEVFPSGSNSSNFEYDWSGSENLNGDNKTESITYDNSGTKSATVRVTLRNNDGFNDDQVTATCHVNVVDNNPSGTLFTPPPQQGVFLDTIPATGINPTVKTTLFMSGLVIWSAFLGYIYIRRRNLKIAEQKMLDDAMNS